VIHFVVPAAQEKGIREYLELWGLDVAARFQVLHYESLPAVTRFMPGTYVLAALDQLPPGSAAFVRAFHGELADRPDVRFLNDPTRTWQRAQLLDELHRCGRNDFRAAPITADLASLRYPVFVRDWRSHGGPLSPLLHRPSQVESAIGRALVQGHPADDLLVVEFCDTADADGYFRKYAAFVVGDNVIPRSLSYSREWMLKFGGSEFSRAMVEEELEYLVSNPHEAALRETFALAGVRYGRIDYAVKVGRLQTWEINLNPTIGRGRRPSTGKVPAELEAIRRQGKEHFYRRFREAWESVDLVSTDPLPLDIQIPDSIGQAALAEARSAEVEPSGRGSGWLATLRRVLRPAKPLVDPMVAPALSLIARDAQRKARRQQQTG
jgi:hypothetical protein